MDGYAKAAICWSRQGLSVGVEMGWFTNEYATAIDAVMVRWPSAKALLICGGIVLAVLAYAFIVGEKKTISTSPQAVPSARGD